MLHHLNMEFVGVCQRLTGGGTVHDKHPRSVLHNKNIQIKMGVNIFLEYIPYGEADSQ